MWTTRAKEILNGEPVSPAEKEWAVNMAIKSIDALKYLVETIDKAEQGGCDEKEIYRALREIRNEQTNRRFV